MSKLSFTSDKKELKSVVEQITKQYITVGEHLQKYLLSKKQEEGKEVKTVREYMESQRAYVWETWRASNLIQSILLQHPIPSITMYRQDDKSQFRKVLDGQQRLTTIYLFINNELRLDMSKTIFPEFSIENEIYTCNDLNGKTFSELPELWQDLILNYDIPVTTMNNCSEEEAEKYFVSMNAGAKALKSAEIRTAAMGIGTRKFFRTVLKSDWVLHAITEKAATANTGNEIVSQIITLIHNNEPIELSKDNIDNVIYSYRENGIPDSMKECINNICDYLNQVTNIWVENKKKSDESNDNKKGKKVTNYSSYRFTWLNKTNTVMLMYAAYKAIQNSITVDQFSTWAYTFFQSPTSEYKEGLQEKAIDLKRVELRVNSINNEIKKLADASDKKQESNTDTNNENEEQNTKQEEVEETKKETKQKTMYGSSYNSGCIETDGDDSPINIDSSIMAAYNNTLYKHEF